ncbi:MAG: hypothetical protein SPI86_02240 [Treponemataceae bacterium]|nr:hypothetical protein [Spirochaetales bacterium]MDY6030561.1 hypothetical protein [Treponemataceae bacterium]
MDHISYFKLQAKNLFKDYQTRYFSESEKRFCYHPKYFNIPYLFLWLDYYDNEADFSFTLMNAQHVIAQMVGFDKWNDLIKAKQTELELAHLVFDSYYKQCCNKKFGPFGIEFEIQKMSLANGFGEPCYYPTLSQSCNYGVEIKDYKFIGSGIDSKHAKIAVMKFVYVFLSDEKIRRKIDNINSEKKEMMMYGCFGKIRLVKKYDFPVIYTGEARFWSDEMKMHMKKEFEEVFFTESKE